jgi:hypothetical protein
VTYFLKLIILALVLVSLHYLWARYRIRQWMEANGYTLKKCSMRVFRIGPFSYFATSGKQSVFRVEAVDSEGRVRTGYIRVGGFFLGLWQRRVDVRWDKSLLEEFAEELEKKR